jgi:hypothetical protein
LGRLLNKTDEKTSPRRGFIPSCLHDKLVYGGYVIRNV